MSTQSDMERERYEARRKFQHDYNSDMGFERREGRKIGALIGTIRTCIHPLLASSNFAIHPHSGHRWRVARMS